MINSISHWLSRHPYGITSIVFMIIVLFAWRMLGWGEGQLGFLLLLYFIVALGIRLDDITRAIGGSIEDLAVPSEAPALIYCAGKQSMPSQRTEDASWPSRNRSTSR